MPNNSFFTFLVIFRQSLYYTFLILIFFPYLSFFNLETDMQPNALILSFFLVFFFKSKITSNLFLIGLVFFSSILVFIVSGLNFVAMRSFFNYSSLFFLSYMVYKILRTERINFEIFLKISIWVWFLIGFFQSVLDKKFMTFLISQSRSTENRGVTGLAPEPTFYGIVFIFFILFILNSNISNKKFYIFICVFGVIFFAKATMAFLFLIILLLLYLVTHISIKYFFISILGAFFTPLFVNYFLEGSRLSSILNIFLENPSKLILLDASINDRFFHIFFSLKGFVNNFFIPNGFSSWNNYVKLELSNYLEYVIIEWFSVGDRIMSGYGAAFYELGFFAFLIPWVLFKLFYSLYKNDLKILYFHFFFINLIMFSAIPIGFSLFAFYIGYLSYLVWKKNRVGYA